MLAKTTEIIKSALRESSRFALLVIAAMVALYVCSGVYSISENEVGVLLRFGKVVNDRVSSGIHYALPWPIDGVYKVPIKMMHTLGIDDFALRQERDSEAAKFAIQTGLETYCISGDNNIITINCVLQYQVRNAAEYLFSTVDARRILRDLTSNTLIQYVATVPVDKILTYGKKEMEDYIRREVSSKLEQLKFGLVVTFVEIREIKPPSKVQRFFDDVVNAKIDKERLINHAESNRYQKLHQANADAYRMCQDAKAYAIEVVSRAEGETLRFLDKLNAFQQAKSTVRKNMWLEFAREVFPTLDRVYVIEREKGQTVTKIRIPARLAGQGRPPGEGQSQKAKAK